METVLSTIFHTTAQLHCLFCNFIKWTHPLLHFPQVWSFFITPPRSLCFVLSLFDGWLIGFVGRITRFSCFVFSGGPHILCSVYAISHHFTHTTAHYRNVYIHFFFFYFNSNLYVYFYMKEISCLLMIDISLMSVQWNTLFFVCLICTNCNADISVYDFRGSNLR